LIEVLCGMYKSDLPFNPPSVGENKCS
jgi:hypothetical protein